MERIYNNGQTQEEERQSHYPTQGGDLPASGGEKPAAARSGDSIVMTTEIPQPELCLDCYQREPKKIDPSLTYPQSSDPETSEWDFPIAFPFTKILRFSQSS